MKMRKIRSVISLILAISIIISLAISALALDSEENVIAEEAQIGNRANFTARIMQGNTNEEDDCRAIENGLLNSGGYTTTSIVESGWTYTNSTTSSPNSDRATETNFLYSKLYDFAYFSGHGSATGGPRLNVEGDPAYTSGNYDEFNVKDSVSFGLAQKADFDDSPAGIPIVFQLDCVPSTYVGNSSYTFSSNICYRTWWWPSSSNTPEWFYRDAYEASKTVTITLSN